MIKLKRTLFCALFLFMTAQSINAYAEYQSTMDKLNQMLDVSGENYFSKAVTMVDSASDSVLMSMFLVNPQSEELITLLEGLDRALARGVKVEIYVNARYNADDWAFLNNYFYASPRKQISINPIGDNHFLYHKLIIVDEKTILEGSLNWLRDYDNDRLEYALLMEDRLLAQKKTLFLHRVKHAKVEMENPDLLWRSKMPWISEQVLNASIPVRALTEDNMIWKLIDKKEYDLFDGYLILVFQAAIAAKATFEVNYEDLAYGLSLGKFKEKKQRKKVYRLLVKLQKRGLVDIKSHNNEQTEVSLVASDSPSFNVPIDIVSSDFVRSSGYEFKTAYLMCALLNDIYNRTKGLYDEQERDRLKALLAQYTLAPVPPLLK